MARLVTIQKNKHRNPTQRAHTRTPMPILANLPKVDMHLVGPITWGDGLGRIALSYRHLFNEICSTRLYAREEVLLLQHLPDELSYIKNDKINFYKRMVTKSDLSIFTGLLWAPGIHAYSGQDAFPGIRSSTKHMTCVSMLEGTKIPSQWATALNQYFNIAYLPAEYLIETYRNSGVKIPLKYIPLPIIDMDSFFSAKQLQTDKFIFGTISGGWARKGLVESINCFLKVFRGNKNVEFHIHSRFGATDIMNELARISAKEPNVVLTTGILTDAECEVFKSKLNCFVLASSGEGFSFTPREMLARGVPAIISSGHAHQIIIDEEGATGIPIKRMKPCYNDCYGVIGEDWEPDFGKLPEIMVDMVENYDSYKKHVSENKSALSRYAPKEWLTTYGSEFVSRMDNPSTKRKMAQFLNKKRLLVVHHIKPETNTVAGGPNAFYAIVESLLPEFDVVWLYQSHDRNATGIYDENKYRCFNPTFVSLNDETVMAYINDYKPDVVLSYDWFTLKNALGAIRNKNLPLVVFSEHLAMTLDSSDITNAKSTEAAAAFKKELSQVASEKEVYNNARAALVCNTHDKEVLLKNTSLTNVEVLYSFTEFTPGVYDMNTKNGEICFIGGTYHRASLDSLLYLCYDIMPLVIKEYPSAKLVLYGSPMESAKPQHIKAKKSPFVIDKGYVLDISTCIRKHSVNVVPAITGNGIKNKAILGCSCGVPTLISTRAADEFGLPLPNMSCDTTSEYVEKLVKILTDDSFRAAVALENKAIYKICNKERFITRARGVIMGAF